MTRNEARRMRNLPAVEGGDDLVTPLNVLIGGQANPQDADSTKAAFTQTVEKHLDRLGRVIPAKGYDRARFQKELAQDLTPLGLAHLATQAHDRIHQIMEDGKPLNADEFFAAWEEKS